MSLKREYDSLFVVLSNGHRGKKRTCSWPRDIHRPYIKETRRKTYWSWCPPCLDAYATIWLSQSETRSTEGVSSDEWRWRQVAHSESSFIGEPKLTHAEGVATGGSVDVLVVGGNKLVEFPTTKIVAKTSDHNSFTRNLSKYIHQFSSSHSQKLSFPQFTSALFEIWQVVWTLPFRTAKQRPSTERIRLYDQNGGTTFPNPKGTPIIHKFDKLQIDQIHVAKPGNLPRSGGTAKARTNMLLDPPKPPNLAVTTRCIGYLHHPPRGTKWIIHRSTLGQVLKFGRKWVDNMMTLHFRFGPTSTVCRYVVHLRFWE